MTGRRLLAVAAMIASLAACSSEQPTSSTAPQDTSTTSSPVEASDAVEAFAKALAEIDDRNTAEGAAHELALVIGPIDGIDAQRVPGTHHGTLALRRFETYAADADSDLRDAVDRRLTEIDESTVADFEIEVRAGAAAAGRFVASPVETPVGLQVGTDRVDEDTATLSEADRQRFDRMRVAAEEAAEYVSEVSDVSLRIGFSMVTEFEDPTTLAASREETVGIGPGCRVYFSRGAVDDELELVPTMVHEMIHCVQFRIEPRSGVLPLWVQEGSADHLAAHLAGPTPRTRAWSGLFVTANPFDLAGSDYMAAGFFDHLADEGADVVALAPRLFRSGASDDAAYVALSTEGLGPDVHANFAAGPTQQAAFGAEWTITGPAIPGGAERRPQTLAPDATVAVDALQSGTWVLARPEGDVVALELSGDVRYTWATGTDFVVTGSDATQMWCLGDECVCPSGEPPVDDLKPLPPDAENLTLALSATGRMSTATVTVRSLDELCGTEPTPDPGDDPGALVGTWFATPDAIQRFLERAWASAGDDDPFAGGEPPSFQYLGGDMVMTLSPNGTGEFAVTDLTVGIAVSGIEVQVPMTGGGSFVYRLEGSTIEFRSMTTTLVADIFGEQLVIDTADVGEGDADATIGLLSDDQLILEPLDDEWVVPNEWRRG